MRVVSSPDLLMPDLTRNSPGWPLLLAVAAGFALAYTQSPLFYSNQNQYLLHGLAAAGYGHLNPDWLANTKDPTPVFSFGVAAAYRLAGLWPLQVAFFVLLMAYFVAMWRLVTNMKREGANGDAPPARWTTGQFLVFAAFLTAAHAAVFRLISVRLTGVDYPWFLQAGVAGQYLLGPGLQPSAFGVLLVASLAAFAHGRSLLAAALSAATVDLHMTYSLPAALLTAGYMVALLRDGRARTAVVVGVVALMVVLPAVVYTLATFPPTSAETFAEAQHILATVRIPHHAVVARWFDGVAAFQLIWAAIGIALMRGTRLFLPLVVAAAGAVILTAAQLGTGSDTLALLFPWRLSAVLVSVATAVIVARFTFLLPRNAVLTGVVSILILVEMAGGVTVLALGLGYRVNKDERPLLDWVRAHAGPEDVYLIPTKFPAVGTGRGSMSASFTPPPRPKPGSNLIPVDLQRFRLATGTPIFVDFKSVPYADTEVLEWRRRMREVEAWYAEPDWDAARVRDQLRAEGITHVLIPQGQSIRGAFLEPLYTDRVYTVYRVR